MKILHILDHSIPLHSGYTFRTRAILEQQRKLGWKTVHVTSSKHIAESPEEETVDGLHFYRTRAAGGFLEKTPVLNQFAVVSTLAERLDQVVEKEKPDILHAHSPSLNGLAALRAGRRHRLPVVYECRAFWEDAAVDHGTSREWGLRYRITRALETHVFHKADAVTTICGGLRQEITGRGIPADKVTVIPNAVDIENFQFNTPRNSKLDEQLGLKGKLVLGFIGSFYAYEGLALLVQALPEIVKNVPEAKLLLVGGGPQESLLKEMVTDLDLLDSVLFTGRVPHGEVADYYSLVDVCLYPRLHMRLTDLVTPLKPLEAMAQGKLVVASDVGGHKELIKDGENGRLFSAGDYRSLIKSAVDLIENKSGWSEMQINGRKYVEEERSWPKSVSKYKEVYSKLLTDDKR